LRRQAKRLLGRVDSAVEELCRRVCRAQNVQRSDITTACEIDSAFRQADSLGRRANGCVGSRCEEPGQIDKRGDPPGVELNCLAEMRDCLRQLAPLPVGASKVVVRLNRCRVGP
jgi:hypothetical protein